MGYHHYWNDIEVEKTKAFYVTDPSDTKALRYLREDTFLERCFLDAIKYANERLCGVGHNVLDVAAGICWSSALVSKLEGISKITAVDYSEHRLKMIAPIVIRQLEGRSDLIETECVDFFKADYEKGSFDTIVFCQALYMFDDMEETLKRTAELLSPGGRVIIACERLNIPSFFSLAFLYGLLYGPKDALWQLGTKLGFIPQLDDTGKHYYTDRDYENAIRKAGLDYQFQKLDYRIFPSAFVKGGNYFGIKQ
ncbi:MAG TPA: class I SAM-dependent methyltransferase [Nitrospirae bacterium]|nr:class I SAM-dependent methyltransferase [Nitrospirota bacterium]